MDRRLHEFAARWRTSVTDLTSSAAVFARVGLLKPPRPDRLAGVIVALRRWGPTMAGAFAGNAARFPGRVALVDEHGPLTFDTLNRRSNALAHGLLEKGLVRGATVAVMCRNHAGFVEVTTALAKLGANTLYLNTGFSGPQLGAVVERERAQAVVLDEEFAALADGLKPEVARILAWHDSAPTKLETLDALTGAGSDIDPPVPDTPGRTIILTSGTTGTPRGVPRTQTTGLGPAVAMLSVLPLRAGETTVIAAPLFHSWGFGHLVLAQLLGSTVVLQRRFDPVGTLEAVSEHKATALAAVPVMLQRMLDVPDSVRHQFDLSSLRAVVVSGSSLPGDLARRFMDAFGDVLYNLYGSTEVAYATIATPTDLRACPDTAGRVLRGATVAVLDPEGRPVEVGRRGRIWVGNELVFEGYTGGGTVETRSGLMSSGDVGHFDPEGRLFVDGRADDMIVSGGENVFPEEVETLIAGHEAVAEVAVIGVPDEEFGQRLKAFIVRKSGAHLTADAVREYARANLARYKIPRDVEFIESLPRNLTGKIVRRALGRHEPSDG